MSGGRERGWRAVGGLALAVVLLTSVARAQDGPNTAQRGDHEMATVEPVEEFSRSWECRKLPDMPPSETIDQLKDLHIRTALAVEGEPACVVVVPAGERYAGPRRELTDAVREMSGVDLPVVIADPDAAPEELLTSTNVITFGNMSTNPFIFRMYCRWLCLLDLKWPGSGGHAVLSSHNPCGTGHNVVFLGGSDDGGVAEATGRFVEILREAADGRALSVGWLHEVQPGDVPEPPAVGEEPAYWTTAPGGGQFGFNSISTSACLYYMTGREEYLEQFKRLAFSQPGDVPEELVEDYAYWTPGNPLVETYHYYSHLVPYIWDMIEESPLLTDEERVHVTNKLIEQQDHYDSHDNFGAPNGSRHEIYQMMNIYSGSLYLAKYYPDRRWEQRLANIREAFAAWYESPTWGELDNVGWIPTGIEAVINFFLLDGSWEQFAQAGGVETMVRPLKILWDGTPGEQTINASQAQSLMYKAAYILDDPTWVWLARQAGYDNTRFLVGQSWWPDEDLAPRPPTELVDTVATYPLAASYWRDMGRPFPQEQGYQFAVYRDSLDAEGDFLVLDGTWLCPRLAFHVASPTDVRIDGQNLVTGCPLTVIRREGMVESGRLPAAAALRESLVGDGLAFMSSVVPHAWFSHWSRDLLHITGRHTLVIDRVTAREPGGIEVESTWKLTGDDARIVEGAPDALVSTSAARLACSGVTELVLDGTQVREVVAREGAAAKPLVLVTALTPPGGPPRTLRRVTANAYVLGDEAVIAVGALGGDEVEIDADLAYISVERVFAAGATRMRLGEVTVRADGPVTCEWQPAAARLLAWAEEGVELQVTGVSASELTVGDDPATAQGDGPARVTLPAGRTAIEGLAGDVGAAARLIAALSERPSVAAETRAQAGGESAAAWEPVWRAEAAGAGSAAVVEVDVDGRTWVGGGSEPVIEGMTVEAWVKPGRPAENQALVSRWGTHGERSFMLLLADRRAAVWVSPDGGWAETVTLTGTTELDDAWHHVAATYDGETLRLFVDGAEEATADVARVFRGDAPLLLGRYAGGGYPYEGLMADVRVHEAALTPGAIAHHAQRRVAEAQRADDEPESAWVCAEPGDTPGDGLHDVAWVEAGGGQALQIADGGYVDAGIVQPGLLAVLDEEGSLLARTQVPATVTAICAVPRGVDADDAAVIVGLDDDSVLALDERATVVWRETAEVHSKFWYDGHWRAPWFTDPARNHGIRDIVIDRLHEGDDAEVIVGRACTVEFRALDGGLIERVAIEWGDAATLHTVPWREGGRCVLVGKFLNVGHPSVSLIGPDRALVSNGAYGALPEGYERVGGWQTQGIPHLLSDDLDGDGRLELIEVCCGTWNDLRVYDALTQQPRWARAFGPGANMEKLIADIVVGDLDDDGAGEIVACAQSGWVWAFSASGELLWATRPLQEATAVGVLDAQEPARVVVGGADGALLALDGDGRTLARADVHGSIVALMPRGGSSVIVATDTGGVSRFAPPGAIEGAGR